MPLPQGTHLGPYVIASPLGAGGMGEVYRAHDVRLGRDVAVKILPASVARDTDRLGRFEREARAIAALSHPNIVAVFDTGTAEPRGGPDAASTGTVNVPAVTYVVMELLTGETLASRLALGPLAPRKATEIASRIARGLSAAHDKGVVHRDVKPDNVFLTADGQVKLLDFGLARHGEGSATAAATVVTDAGTVLGTANYMSPEQVRSELAGPRADIFSLGAVLYEMLTGQRPFAAETAAETMTAILRADPPAFSETLAVPPALQRIVIHCLEKRPEERFQSASDVAFALDALSGSTPHSVERVDTPAPRTRLTTERLAWLALALSLAAVAGWLVATRPSPDAFRSPILRATLPLPAGVTLPSDGPHQWRLALSPDGSRVAFVGQTARGERSLWVRALDQDAATRIEGPRNPHRPFWSPDGRELGYSEEGRLLRVVPGSGRPVPIGAVDGRAVWRSADEFLVTFGFGAHHRLITPATDASREILTPTPRPGQVALYPSFLPDGQRLLFALYDAEEPRSGGFYVGGVDGAAMQLVTLANFEADKANAVVANGHLLSVRDGMLIARPFDTDQLTFTGEAFVVGGPVDAPANIGSAAFVAARDVVVYQPAPASTGSRLTWVGRGGSALEEVGGDNDYGQLDLSPDGTRLLYSVTDQGARTRDIWMLDLRRGVTSRVTFDAADERGPIWAPDGERFVYRKNTDLVVRGVTGGEDTPFVVDDRVKDPLAWSPDGKTVLYRVSTQGRGGGSDVWRQTEGGTPQAFLDSSFNENQAQFSPDGRWVAYTSNESGETDVYVTAYPSAQGKWRVSSDGGAHPRWEAEGRELYYLSSSNQMMAVDVRATGAGLEMSQPRVLFPVSIVRTPGAQYVVTGDGQRFLVNMPIPDDKAPALHVVFNWARLRQGFGGQAP